MKIFENKIKKGFIDLFKQRKQERMLQYKFKDDFLDKLQNCFGDNKEELFANKKNSYKNACLNNNVDDATRESLNVDVESCCEIIDL